MERLQAIFAKLEKQQAIKALILFAGLVEADQASDGDETDYVNLFGRAIDMATRQR